MDRGEVQRDRVLRQIGSLADLAPLTAIVAPAGYGKTAVLGQWLHRLGPHPVLVLTLRKATTAGALQRSLRRAEEDASTEGRTDGLDRAVVVVDNAQWLRQDAIAQILAEIDSVHPPSRAWLLVGREIAGTDLTRIRVHGLANVIGLEDLAFDDDELRRLAAVLGVSTRPQGDAARWPALAACVLAGDEDQVVGYLRTVVLGSLPDGVVRLLAGVCLAADGSSAVIAALASALDLPPGTIEGLGSLPLVRRVPTGEVSAHPVPGDPEEPSGVVVDERWTETTASVLSPDAKRAVFRALSQVFLERAELGDAGRMAVAAGDVEALERVVRAALGTQPPRIGLTHLDAWAAVEGLGAGTMAWLEGTAASLRNPISERGAMLFEQARSSFAAAGDLDGEVGVISAAGLHARRRDDIDTIASLLGRIGELGPDADPRLGAFAALANAVMTQMAGRHEDAVAALDDLSMAALDVAWRAQVEMVRATNLMILGRFDEAIAGLERATGTGSAWTRSVAHDLLSLARWVAGDRTGALRDAARSCSLATGREVPGLVSVCEAWRRCLEVLDGADPASSLPPDELGEVSGESARLRTAAAALSLVGLGDDDRAATVLASMRDLPNRAVRSTTLVAALETALDLPRSAHWRALAETDRGLRAAVAAGLAAASHRAGGPPPPPTARPYLPPVWWGPQSQRVNVTLIGSPRVAVGSRQLDAQQLSRGKVRELLLHLVLVPSSSRGRRAEEIWPDLPPARAASNLRVTLTQLLDALHPDRPRGSGTDLLDDTRGRLDLVLGPRLYVDLAELRDEAARCVRLLRGGEREGALAAARCLLDLVEGEVLIDDGAVGSWIEQPRRSLEDLVLRAVTEVGAEAVAAGDHDLAERIGLVALALDPWSEAAGRIVVQARLQRGDPDGARRALTDLVRKLDELGLPPLPDTRTLIARLGVTAAAPRSV